MTISDRRVRNILVENGWISANERPSVVLPIPTDARQKKMLRRWIEALRSGRYEQCTGTLRDPEEGYCCLGVAAVTLSRFKDFRGINESGVERWQMLSSFSGEPANALNLLWRPIGNGSSMEVILSNMNDDGATFDEIADFIEVVYGLEES